MKGIACGKDQYKVGIPSGLSVHPEDRSLLGISWQVKFYVDRKLPFGLRSAPKIFNSITDALEWCFKKRRGDRCQTLP